MKRRTPVVLTSLASVFTPGLSPVHAQATLDVDVQTAALRSLQQSQAHLDTAVGPSPRPCRVGAVRGVGLFRWVDVIRSQLEGKDDVDHHA